MVNKELKNVMMRIDANKLSFKVEKTNYIIFKSPQHSALDTISIEFENLPVKQTGYVKFVGVLLDENLSWKYHLPEISKKLAKICGMLSRQDTFLVAF